MRRLILSLALLITFTSTAHAQFLNQTWTERGEIVAAGHMRPEGLQLLMRYTINNRMEVMDPPEGSFYILPSTYSQMNQLEVLVRDFDLDGFDELCLFVRTPEPDDRVALFDLWPEPGPRWEICCWFWYDSVRTAALTGAGIEILVFQDENFFVLESWTGDIVFDWHEAYGSWRVLGTQLMDLDEDGREELLVQAEHNTTQYRSVYVLEHGGAVGIGPDPLTLEARPLTARNTPNPFDGPTRIEFDLPARDRVAVRVYDAAGRLVKTLVDELRDAGGHFVAWDGTDDAGHAVRSGAYFCEVESGAERIARKMIRIR